MKKCQGELLRRLFALPAQHNVKPRQTLQLLLLLKSLALPSLNLSWCLPPPPLLPAPQADVWDLSYTMTCQAE